MMTPEQLLQQILVAVLLINNRGKWHAFYDISGAHGRLDVRFAPADHNWLAPNPGPWPGPRNYAHFIATPRDPDPEPALIDLLDWTKSFLNTEPAA